MSTEKQTQFQISRRSFLQGVSVLGSGAALAQPLVARAASAADTLPRRVLGRTKLEVSALTLGTWPCGMCESISIPAVGELVNEAIDLGINVIDTGRVYGKAEDGIGKALEKRRDQVILTTKVMEDTAEGAKASFEKSLRLLKTDHVDILYIHNMGGRNVEQVLAADGALSYLLKQKEAGKARFLGVSGHNKPLSFVPMIETGDIDVLLIAMNFVDRYTYGFEDKVLPVANRHNVGVSCMKVFGGMKGGFGVATGPDTGPQMGKKRLSQAVRYAMGLPGVATLTIGPHTVQQLRQNVELVKNFQPLSAAEKESLAKLGKRLAPEWGDRFGPVA